MTATLCQNSRFALHLGPPAPGAAAALALVARHLDLPADTLRAARPDHPLRRNLPLAEAQRLQTLLRAAGWPATLHPDGTAPATNLALQPAPWADRARLSRRLATLLHRPAETIAQALARPGGLLLPATDPRRALLPDSALHRLHGLRVLTSDPQTALYDLYPTRPLSPAQSARLAQTLHPFAPRPDDATGALAVGLTAALARRILARIGRAPLFALDRRFQRFDLHLIGTSGWVSRDLADFLALRTGQPRARFEVISPDDPVILDTALTPEIARHFWADYAAIGLFTRLHLCGLQRNAENPDR